MYINYFLPLEETWIQEKQLIMTNEKGIIFCHDNTRLHVVKKDLAEV